MESPRFVEVKRIAQMWLMLEPGLHSTEKHSTMLYTILKFFPLTKQEKMLQESPLKSLGTRRIGSVYCT